MNKEAFDRGFVKAALDNGINILQATELLKLADGNQALMTGIGGLAGGLGGGLGGALKGFGMGAPIGAIYGGLREHEKPENQRHTVKAMLDKGLLGGSLGAGAGGLVGGGMGAIGGAAAGYNMGNFQQTLEQLGQLPVLNK
jgi:hypothetical protein